MTTKYLPYSFQCIALKPGWYLEHQRSAQNDAISPAFQLSLFLPGFTSGKTVHTGVVTFCRLLLVLIDTGVVGMEEGRVGKTKNSLVQNGTLIFWGLAST